MPIPNLVVWAQRLMDSEFPRKIRILLPENKLRLLGSWEQQMFITSRNVIPPLKKLPMCWEDKEIYSKLNTMLDMIEIRRVVLGA